MRQQTILQIAGILFLLLVWYLLTLGENPMVHPGILPKPLEVLLAYGELYQDNELIKNVCRSMGLNLLGYTEAIVLALPLGFIVGLYPFFRGTLQRPVDAFRFVPLTAVTGLFIIWFGLGTGMKVHFLAFGILIYLLPVVVQRIDEVKEVYLKTVYTLGATDWQTIKSVYIPSVISRLSDDIRVLTAISWTYIIIAESLGSEGGIGALLWRVGQRQGRVDKVFALLVIIIIIGFTQDKIFNYLDRTFFPYKYQTKNKYAKADDKSVTKEIFNYAFQVTIWLLIAIYFVLLLNEFMPVISDEPVLSYLFGDTVGIIHFYAFLLVSYKGYKLLQKNKIIAAA